MSCVTALTGKCQFVHLHDMLHAISANVSHLICTPLCPGHLSIHVGERHFEVQWWDCNKSGSAPVSVIIIIITIIKKILNCAFQYHYYYYYCLIDHISISDFCGGLAVWTTAPFLTKWPRRRCRYAPSSCVGYAQGITAHTSMSRSTKELRCARTLLPATALWLTRWVSSCAAVLPSGLTHEVLSLW